MSDFWLLCWQWVVWNNELWKTNCRWRCSYSLRAQGTVMVAWSHLRRVPFIWLFRLRYVPGYSGSGMCTVTWSFMCMYAFFSLFFPSHIAIHVLLYANCPVIWLFRHLYVYCPFIWLFRLSGFILTSNFQCFTCYNKQIRGNKFRNQLDIPAVVLTDQLLFLTKKKCASRERVKEIKL